MRTFFILLLTMVLTLGFAISDAQAKRFGGGRSFGVSRSMGSFSRPQSNFTRTNQGINSNANRPNRWLGPLAGLAMGGLLASLFMGHGIGTGLLSWLVVAGIALLIFNALRNRKQQNMYSATANYQGFQKHFNQLNTAQASGFESNDFNTTDFLRDAKAKFLRLQTAYDQKNLNDIREFSTPEVCAEIQLQFQERGDAFNQTEVVSIEADLLDVVQEAKTVASVQFSGLIREEGHTVAASFDEIWHFVQADSGQWLVAGIQQN